MVEVYLRLVETIFLNFEVAPMSSPCSKENKAFRASVIVELEDAVRNAIVEKVRRCTNSMSGLVSVSNSYREVIDVKRHQYCAHH